MRNAFIKALCEEAKKNPKIMLLTGDLGFNIIEPFIGQYPNQFINVGVAEANLITISAGLAATGFIPFAYSIATFATMRPFEQIRNDVILQNLNVKIVGVGGGLAYSKAGPTHHSMEDIALMRLLPNMTIVVPCDKIDAYQATKALAKHIGPAYIRIERNPANDIYNSSGFKLGKGKVLKIGKHIALLLTGTKVELALEVSSKLIKRGIDVSIFAFPTVQPLDERLLKAISQNHKFLITIEEHRVDGGFGTAVLEHLSNFRSKSSVFRFGLRNKFSPFSASYDKLMDYHRLTVKRIANYISHL